MTQKYSGERTGRGKGVVGLRRVVVLVMFFCWFLGRWLTVSFTGVRLSWAVKGL